jgi:oligopeptidase B
MYKSIRALLFAGVVTAVLASCSTEPTLPRAAKNPHSLVIHGHERVDNYFWLRERENPQVIAYLQAENTYREKIMAPYASFENSLFEEMKSRIKQDDSSVPARRGDFWYYKRYETGQEYPVYCRKKESLDAAEEILLDVNELAAGQDFCSVQGFKTSPDHSILSYAVDFVGRRKYVLKFIDAKTGEALPDEIPDMTGNYEWANDNKTIFYTRQHPETLRWERIKKHVLGEQDDELVYFEEDETYDTSIGKTLSDEYLTIFNQSTLQTETLILNANVPDGQFTPFLPREDNHEYFVEHGGDRWYILTNDNAKNFKLMQTPETNTAKSFWQTVIPHHEDVLLEDFSVFKNYVVIEDKSFALSHIRILNRKTNQSHSLDCEEPIYIAYVDENLEYDTEVLRYGFESPKTPESIFDYNMRTRTKELKKQQQVLGSFDANTYETERLWVTARDGVDIPVSILYKKGLKRDGQNPTLIYAYGSYGSSMSPWFSSKRFSLVDRGFIYVIAHIRGGSEMGRAWYEDGRQLHKKNTFTDFIDCTKHLINENYTSPEHIYAQGGSAGGLLMGAISNMAPDLYNGIIAEVPFVDVITTMLDETIPLTTSEYDEWGNPNEKEYYDYILSYSPYDNVEAKDYPNMFITAGLHDSQVQYWEPAKWTAKLRELKTDDNLLLLYTNMDAGHGGASGRFQSLREDAMQYTFVLALEGVAE